jgi:hypothetical protein
VTIGFRERQDPIVGAEPALLFDEIDVRIDEVLRLAAIQRGERLRANLDLRDAVLSQQLGQLVAELHDQIGIAAHHHSLPLIQVRPNVITPRPVCGR